jgi:uncharacterized spore protein YtfJ
MSELFKSLENLHGTTQAEASELVGRLFEVARPGAVFAEPVTVEGRTVITASEVTVGMGIGFGVGGGTAPAAHDHGEEGTGPGPAEEGIGVGGGGGGGGGASGRPVAAIIIDPAGVRVEPIVDVTKLGLAFLTAFGAIFAMNARMRRVRRG